MPFLELGAGQGQLRLGELAPGQVLAPGGGDARACSFAGPGKNAGSPTGRPMSENAVLYLIHHIGYKDRMTGHGWRSVASTWANENGYNRDHIEQQLAHGSDDKVRDAYNHAAYLPQRRVMMQDWADWLDRCRG